MFQVRVSLVDGDAGPSTLQANQSAPSFPVPEGAIYGALPFCLPHHFLSTYQRRQKPPDTRQEHPSRPVRSPLPPASTAASSTSFLLPVPRAAGRLLPEAEFPTCFLQDLPPSHPSHPQTLPLPACPLPSVSITASSLLQFSLSIDIPASFPLKQK